MAPMRCVSASVESASSAPVASGGHRLSPEINRTVGFLHANFADPLMVPDLARLARLSPFHFIRRFRAETGCTPHRYLTLLRMRHAKALLAGEPDTAIREVGYRSGYDEPAAFARAFRRSVGMAPQEYRRRRMAEAVLALAASAS